MSEDTFVVKTEGRKAMTPEEVIEYVNEKVEEGTAYDWLKVNVPMSNREVADPLQERWKAYATLAHG